MTRRDDTDRPGGMDRRGRPALDAGDSFSRTFTAPDATEYCCGLYPHMTGRITVTP